MSFLKISQLELIGWTGLLLEGVKLDSIFHDFFWCILLFNPQKLGNLHYFW